MARRRNNCSFLAAVQNVTPLTSYSTSRLLFIVELSKLSTIGPSVFPATYHQWSVVHPYFHRTVISSCPVMLAVAGENLLVYLIAHVVFASWTLTQVSYSVFRGGEISMVAQSTNFLLRYRRMGVVMLYGTEQEAHEYYAKIIAHHPPSRTILSFGGLDSEFLLSLPRQCVVTRASEYLDALWGFSVAAIRYSVLKGIGIIMLDSVVLHAPS